MTVAVSSMTLGWMIKHLSLVEDYWFAQWLGGREGEPPWVSANWETDPDWDWHGCRELALAAQLTLARIREPLSRTG